ncbi:hypothetical protein HO173_005146 [Letharia columbiana]|uniref:Uncharacterized protein n=1 Tax=Letharia columbiana TaxID=112416 RepID=A0A8H6FXV5_9LECA|nr:uncharacterized protein HO173_005146 [Letharia columbiana]KAF6236855.1 hypothetical protein HO173_005146 [Letharia columbiana]
MYDLLCERGTPTDAPIDIFHTRGRPFHRLPSPTVTLSSSSAAIQQSKCTPAPRDPQLDAARHTFFESAPEPPHGQSRSTFADLEPQTPRIRVPREDLEYYNLTSVPVAGGFGPRDRAGRAPWVAPPENDQAMEYKDDFLSTKGKRRWRSGERTSIIGMEMMRVSIMYRGRPSPGTFHYLSENRPRLTAVALGCHQCVNRDSLLEWVGVEPC